MQSDANDAGGAIKWPALPEFEPQDARAAVKLALYQAQLDVIKADRTAEIALVKAMADAAIEDRKREATADLEREKADWANEYAQSQAVNSAYLDVAKEALNRATAKATFVQGAATAISGAYVAILGFSFAIAQGKPLPRRGILPGFFLGLAIALAAAYVAFITKPTNVEVTPSDGTLPGNQRQRRNNFVVWARSSVLQRRNLLQASVVSLGVGVGLLPLPYLSIPTWSSVTIGSVALIAVVFVLWLDRND